MSGNIILAHQAIQTCLNLSFAGQFIHADVISHQDGQIVQGGGHVFLNVAQEIQ